jgi:flavodoxin
MKATCKLLALVLVLVLALGAAACSGGSSSAPAGDAASETAAATEKKEVETLVLESKTARKTLVVYFSATGTTKRVAETVASIMNADLYEIVPAQPYSEADLNYEDESSRAYTEQHDSAARPAIGGEVLSLDDYGRIYLGYPIWFDQAPRIINTFLESYDLSQKTIIPFCTSNSSEIDNSVAALSDTVTCKKWLKGYRFGADATEEDIRQLVNGSNL